MTVSLSKAKTISTALTEAVPTGGTTVWLTSERPAGYVVGGIRPGLCYDRLDGKPLTVAHIIEWVREILAHAKGVDTIGVWVDEADGAIYVDAGRFVADKADAVKLARSLHEIAVWDLAAGAEVRV